MKKYEIEKNPETVGKKTKKLLCDQLDEKVSKNTLAKDYEVK